MLNGNLKVKSPNDLRLLLSEIRSEVGKETLRQLPAKEGGWQTEIAIQKIPEEGPWPDYIEIDFEVTQSGERYRLTAETFHGCGGSWQKI